MMPLSKWLRFAYVCAVGGLGSLMVLSSAYADNCDNLDKNSAWTSGFQELNAAYKQENWDEALKVGKKLEGICELSPVLNYTIARVHKNKGDRDKYMYYLQKSTLNTERFAVDRDLLERMWNEKYIATHPEADPEHIKSLNQEIETLKLDLEHAKDSNDSLSSSTISKDQHIDAQIKDFTTPLWVATGIGAGGIAMTVAGAVLVSLSDPVEFKNKSGVPGKYKESMMHTTGWTLVGVGSAFAISGAIFAGILGYKYMRSKDNLSLSFELSPTNSSILIEF